MSSDAGQAAVSGAADAPGQRERVLATVLENSPDIIVRYDLSLRRIYANPCFDRLSGLAPADYLGRRPSELAKIGDGNVQVLERCLRVALETGQAQEVDFEWRTADGRSMWHGVRILAERDAQGRAASLLSIGADITARKQAEQGLAQRERELRSLVEHSPDNIARYDADGRFVYLNPALIAATGLALGEVLGKTPAQVWPDLHESTFLEYGRTLRHMLAGGEAAEIEIDWVGPSGKQELHHVRFVAMRTPEGRLDGVLAIGRDITAHKRAEDALWRREQEFRALVEQSPDLIERYDRQGRRVYANPALRALTGDDPGHGRAMGVVEAEDYQRMVGEVLASGRGRQAEWRYRRPDGSTGWLDARLCPEIDGGGGVASVFAVSRDITESVEQRERIQAMALSDPLTRLRNRQALYDCAPALIAQAQRHGRKLGVMILDLDHFKDVNDTLGHAAGDELLCEVARRLAGCMRAGDLLVRLGGDEFAIVAADVEAEFDMAAIARKIARTLAPPVRLGGRQMVVGVSIGIALFPADGEGLDQLVAHADVAMYQAKRGGRSRYEFYRREFSERARDRLALEEALRGACHGDGLELHYQPLVALQSGRIVGAEALLRWRHPELGLLAPDRFISLAEETGLIVPIGRWVIDQAAQAVRRWNAGRACPLRVAVNVSTRQFLEDDVAAVVCEALERTGCRPQWLGIEVTESLLLEDSARIQETFRELRAMGVQIAIDDFGTGYSALNYLSKFDVSCLKIDRQFVHGIEADPRQAELVKAFILIARALGLSVVAEGVETNAQASFLLASGTDIAQGYLFGRPLPPERFELALDVERPDPEAFDLV